MYALTLYSKRDIIYYLFSLEYKLAAKLIISSGIDLFIDPVYDAGTDFRGTRNEHG